MIFNLDSITESTQKILDTIDLTTETPISAITTGFMRTKRSTTTKFSNTINIPRTSDVSKIATTKISDIRVQHKTTTPVRLSQIKDESTSTVITSIVNIKKMTFDTITKPSTTMKTTTRKIPTHILGKTQGKKTFFNVNYNARDDFSITKLFGMQAKVTFFCHKILKQI